jgi:hypothetical protein
MTLKFQAPALIKPVEFNQEIPLTEPTSIQIPSVDGESVLSFLGISSCPNSLSPFDALFVMQIASINIPADAFSSFGSTVVVTVKEVPDSEIRQSSNPNWPPGDSTGYIFSPPIDINIPDDGKNTFLFSLLFPNSLD